jgi:Flp pilus assembly protein TadD
MTRDPEHEAKTWLGMAESLIKRMDFDKAENALRRAVAAAPKYPLVWIKLGDFLASQHKVEEARTAYYKAVELDPTLDVGDFDEKLGGKKMEADVDTSELLLEGVQAMLNKQMYKARKRFEKATDIKPEHAAAWRLLGNARVLDGDVKGAKEAHQKAAKLEPWSIKEYRLDQEDLSRPADDDLVLGHTEYMIRLLMTPPYGEVMSLAGKKEKLEEKTLFIELSLEEDPFQQEVWREYGAVLLLQDRFEDAARAFAKSLELNIDDYESDFDYTIALYRYGVNNWRYVTEREAMKLMRLRQDIKDEFSRRLFKRYYSGDRDPGHYI